MQMCVSIAHTNIATIPPPGFRPSRTPETSVPPAPGPTRQSLSAVNSALLSLDGDIRVAKAFLDMMYNDVVRQRETLRNFEDVVNDIRRKFRDLELSQ